VLRFRGWKRGTCRGGWRGLGRKVDGAIVVRRGGIDRILMM